MIEKNRSPGLATLLAIILWPAGLLIGGALGWAVVIVAQVVQSDGFWRVRQISFDAVGIAEVPAWFSADRLWWTNLLGASLGILGGTAGIVGTVTLWRFLVVQKFGWLTAEEADEHMKRAAD